MLAEADRQVAAEFRRQLEGVIPQFDLRVFGSRARGESGRYSDLDLFVLVPKITPGLRTTISEIAWRVGLDADVVVSTFVATYEQLESGALGASPLLHAIEDEGVPV